jgi:NAD(P)-dependent dehydrogenase (short-subunit alcohol dehydrogenase family)
VEPDRRVAIITGGSRDIGAALVAGYRGRGWAVVASARKIKPSEADDLLTVAGDIADPATADRIADAALDRFGRIDTLVNNAGVYISKPFTEYTAEDYATITGVNLAGFFWLTRRVIAEMALRYGGHVVNVSATSTPSRPASSRPRCTRRKATKGSAASFPRSGAWGRSATWSTASCSWNTRRTSPASSCTSTAARPPVTDAGPLGRRDGRLEVGQRHGEFLP